MKWTSLSTAKWLFLSLLMFVSGCATPAYVDNHAKEWLSRPLSDLKLEMAKPDSYASRVGWKETTYPLVNGNTVFIEPFSEDCAVHWEVTPKETILAFKPVGKGCELAENPTDRQMKSMTAPSRFW